VQLFRREYRRRCRRFTVETADRVRLAGVHLDGAGSDRVMVYAHGFLSSKNTRAVPAFLEAISATVDVLAFDFRGHGESAGRTTFGRDELVDLDALVGYARDLGYRTVVTLGSSMGGATVLRYAGLAGGVDGVATVGAFAASRPLGRPATTLALHLAFNSALGRAWVQRAYGTRVGTLDIDAAQPIDLVDRIAPIPLLLIHGAWDPLIPRREAAALFARAGEPKEIVIIPRGGHDHPLLNPATAERLDDWMRRRIRRLAADPPARAAAS